MKKSLSAIVALAASLNLIALHAQPGAGGRPGMGGPGGPMISEAMSKLFGANSTFTAAMETEIQPASQTETVTMPTKISYDAGKARLDTSMSEWKGTHAPPQAIEQIKTMGMDNMIVISKNDSSVVYTIFPGLHAYMQMSIPTPNTNHSAADFKVDTTELGKETVDGHACVKKKMVVTDKEGKKEEFTVWSASDLKDFPIKIITTESGNPVTMSFKGVKFDKPDASQFEPPSGYTKYTNQMEMMQKEVMKRLPQGGMGGVPVSK